MTYIAPLTPKLRAISSAFLAARKAGKSLAAYPGAVPGSLAESYAIQLAAIKNWPDQIAGYKVGGVAPAFQSAAGANRVAGPVFYRAVRPCAHGESVKMDAFAGGFLALEPEYMIELSGMKALPNRPVTAEDLPQFVRAIYIGAEIASSPLATLNALGPMSIASDFGNNNGIVLGPKVSDNGAFDFAKARVSAKLGGVLVGQKHAAIGEAGPYGAAAFLINHLRDTQLPLHDGLLVSSGAITGVHDAVVGQTGEVEFDGLGTIQIEFEASKGLK